nr:hypothetical protein SHINE37_44802 [Rhizobiaceae bacterium]
MKHGSNEPAHRKGIMRGTDTSSDPYAIWSQTPCIGYAVPGPTEQGSKIAPAALFDHAKF